MKKYRLILLFIIMFLINIVSVKADKADTYFYGLSYKKPGNPGFNYDNTYYWTPLNQKENQYTEDDWYDNQFALDVDESGKVVFNASKSAALSGYSFSNYENYLKYVNGAFGVRGNNDFDSTMLSAIKRDLENYFPAHSFSFDVSDIQSFYDKRKTLPAVILVCSFFEGNKTNLSFYVPSTVGDKYNDYLNKVKLDTSSNKVMIDSSNSTYVDGVNDAYSYCTYIALNKDVKLVCSSIEDGLEVLKQTAAREGCDSQDFSKAYDWFENLCDSYRKKYDASAECSAMCDSLETEYFRMCNTEIQYRCGSLGTELVGWLMKILKIIRYIIPVIVIILSVLDYIQAVGSSNDEALKKASGKFAKRIIISIVIFLLPVILQFLFDVFKIKGLSSNNPFCMK